MSPTPFVRHAHSERDLQWLYHIEQEEYGSDSILSYEKVFGWWQRYPKGTYRLTLGSDIIGGLGLWPLTESAFTRLTSGQMDETDLKVEDVVSATSEGILPFWYVGDIILEKSYRQTKARWASILLIQSLQSWLQIQNVAFDVKISALLYSPQGKSLARKLGFCPVAQSPSGHDVYLLSSTLEQIKERLESFRVL